MNNNIICPTDRVFTDENRVRVTAFWVMILAAAFLLTGGLIIVVFLLVDFLLRVLNLNRFSPLALFGGLLIKQAGIKARLVDRAPKRFAAMIGLVFLILILALFIIKLNVLAQALTSVLLLFASLEAFSGFCAGCHVYSWLKRLKVIN